MDDHPEKQPDRPDERPESVDAGGNPPLPWLPPQALPRQPVPTYGERWRHWTDDR